MNPDTHVMETGLQKINQSTYYLNDQHDGTYGAMKTGWQNVNNNWYYFNNGGAATTGWYQSQAGNWYYFNQDGQAQTRWYSVNNHLYYGDPTNAWTLRGWQVVNGSWHYFDPSETWAETGWQFIDGHWYYLDPANYGAMLVGLQYIGKQAYYLNYDHDGTYGAMMTGAYKLDDQNYLFGSDGAAVTGWQDNNQYYYDPQTGVRASGDTVIDGHHYYFDPATGLKQTGLVAVDNVLKYYSPDGQMPDQIKINGTSYQLTNGTISLDKLTNGLNTIDGQSYYYNADAHNLLRNTWQKVNGKWYYFTNNGNAQTGWYKSGAGLWYLFNADGSAKSGWYQSQYGNWYYLDPENAWALTGWQQINGNWYYFDTTNAWDEKGWFQSQYGNWYYFDPTNCWAMTGWQKINDQWYYFDLTNANMYLGEHDIDGTTYYFDQWGHWIPMRTPINYYESSETVGYPNVSQLSNLWIHVEIGKNRVFIMNGNNIAYVMYCSAGYYQNGRSTTPTGTYYIQSERGNSFYNGGLGEGANYWTSFLGHGVYLFHSVPTTVNGSYNQAEAAKLGVSTGSHGCIRLSVSDAKWFMNNIPTGTRVVINN